MTLTVRASSALTHGVASLASSTTRVAGRISAAYSNTTNKDEALSVSVQITTGTSPTAGGSIEAWLVAQRADGTWPDLFTTTYSGSDGAITIRSRDILRAGASLLGSVINDATSNVPYELAARDVSLILGLTYVPAFAVFVVHSTGVALNSTAGNHKTVVGPSYWA